MSLFHTEVIACPACGAEAEQPIANSVAAARRPDLREAILDGSFQRLTCERCQAQFRVSPVLTYMDVARGSWILVRPLADRALWESFEAGALDVFNDSFGPAAPAAAQGLGQRIKPRVTFGYSGLREKLLCEDLGISDVTLELLKLALMRTTESGRISETASLRLVEHKPDGTLLLAWVSDTAESADEAIEVPPALVAEIDADPAWSAIRSELSNGPFVDATKLIVEPELAVPD